MSPLADTFPLGFPGSFLLGGLELVQKQLKELRVPLHVVKPPNHDQVGETLCEHLDEWQPRVVLCDTSPLVPYRTWLELQLAPLLSSRSLPLIHVDAHNIVPVWHASPKREIGARTLRPRLHRLMPLFLTEYPEFSGNAHIKETLPTPDFNKQDYITFLCWDDSVKSVEWAQPGTDKANQQFDLFVDNGLKRFDELRNDPNYRDVCSNLSPWINHGHVSFQTLARKVKKLNKHANGTAAYIEEGVVRRELSDNFVFYTPDVYDSLQAALGWAQETLETHSSDEREWLFSLEELENSLTHDDLWNAAQMQLVQEGKLHGFVSYDVCMHLLLT
jgi:deoxyribodipyrimidine photo-lyase